MSDTILRQWAMLRRIPRRPQKVTVRELATHLEAEGFSITRRQIQRDLLELSAVFPLASDSPAKPAGWQWISDQAFDLPGMDPPTALAFEMTKQFMEKQLPAAFVTGLEPYFQRARAVLDSSGTYGLADWPQRIRVVPNGFRPRAPTLDENVLRSVYDAVLKQQRLAIEYVARGEQSPKSCEISPLGVVVKEPVMYLVCTFWNYDDVRQIAIHRIRTATVLGVEAEIPDGFSLDSYVASGEFSYPLYPKRQIDLVAIFSEESAVHLTECAIGPNQTAETQSDGRVRVKATVLDSSEFRWWLLGFGDHVEVIKPTVLRKWFTSAADRLSGVYDGRK